MADELTIEVLAPERLEEMRAEELEKLRAEIESLVLEIRRHEWRDLTRSLDNPYQAPQEDGGLPIMRNRLAQRRSKLVEILNATQSPQGVEDPGLSKDAPKDRAAEAVKDVLMRLVRKRALPADDPLISDEEVVEEHERQTGDGAGSRSSRRRPVRSRGS